MKNKFNILTIIIVVITSIAIFLSSCKPNIQAEAASIELISGNNQTGNIETELPIQIEVLVKDQEGNTFQNATVKFTVEEGSITYTTVTTDTNGKASTSWTLGTSVGTQNLIITVFKADGTTALAGSPITVNAIATKAEVIDIDGNTYKVVKIGNQTWMAENLKATKYADETPITKIEDNTEWANLGNNNTDKAYCYPNNNENNDYGALYTYAAATNGVVYTTVDVQGVCPDGWHLPNQEEWQELNDYLGADAGIKLKEAGTSHWESPNTGATNSTNFTALPAGYRNSDGDFESINRITFWWTSSEEIGWSDYGQTWYVNLTGRGLLDKTDRKSEGKSVRCIMD